MEQENLKDNSNTNIPGECHIVQVGSKTKECWHRSHLFQRSPCKETNNCIIERLSVKIINYMYLPAYALAVTTNYDLLP